MIIIFILISIFMILSSIYRYERFGIYKLALFSAFVYFLPGFFGFVQLPYFYGIETIELRVYIILLVFLVVVYTFSIVNGKSEKKVIQYQYTMRDSVTLPILVAVSIILFVLMFLTMGSDLFSTSKSDIADSHNRWRMLFQYTASIGLVYTFIVKKKFVFLLFLIFNLFNMYTGNRSHTAMAFIAIMYLQLLSLNKFRLIKYKKLIISALIFGSLFFIVKGVSGAIRAGLYDVALNRLFSLEFYQDVVVKSEPFVIQNILNQVVKTNYYLGLEVYETILANLVPFYTILFDKDLITFSSKYAEDFYGNVEYGMGSNVLAEAYAGGGFVFVFIWIIFYCIALMSYEKILYLTKNNFLRAALALGIAYMVFYIHRNNLSYQILIQRRIFLIVLVLFLISELIYRTYKKKVKKI